MTIARRSRERSLPFAWRNIHFFAGEEERRGVRGRARVSRKLSLVYSPRRWFFRPRAHISSARGQNAGGLKTDAPRRFRPEVSRLIYVAQTPPPLLVHLVTAARKEESRKRDYFRDDSRGHRCRGAFSLARYDVQPRYFSRVAARDGGPGGMPRQLDGSDVENCSDFVAASRGNEDIARLGVIWKLAHLGMITLLEGRSIPIAANAQQSCMVVSLFQFPSIEDGESSSVTLAD